MTFIGICLLVLANAVNPEFPIPLGIGIPLLVTGLIAISGDVIWMFRCRR